ncbi:MAG: putative sulfate exporter family transporter, partial [Fusobacterium sp.]
MKDKWRGFLLCLSIAVPSWILGRMFPIIGGPVISIILGMILTNFIKNKDMYAAGVKFTSKKIL